MRPARHSRRATSALQDLATRDPTLAALSLWCAHVDDDATSLAAHSDSARVHYGPAFADLTREEQVGLAAHHILHIALRHAPRGAAMRARLGDRFDSDLWNIAADAILNQVLIDAEYILPRPRLLLSELLLAALPDTAPSEALSVFDVDRLFLRLLNGRPPDGSQTRQGGGTSVSDPAEKARAHARKQAFKADLAEAEAAGAQDDGPQAADWQQRVSQAFSAGRAAGYGIGAAGHLIADLPASRVPWEAVLRHLVTRAVTQIPRLSPGTPSRRWLARDADARARSAPQPAFEAGWRRDGRIPRIALGIDTSGSIDDTRLRLFTAQIDAIARRTGAEVHLLAFDEAVQARAVLRPGQGDSALDNLAITRGGGTSFVDIVTVSAGLDPSILVVLTDLDGKFGPDPRRFPVLWAVPEDPPDPPPPFGRVLSLAR